MSSEAAPARPSGMFIGHFALALAAKPVSPRTSLGTLFAAAQLADLVWPILLLLGLESVRMVSATDSVATFLNAAVNRAERRQQAIALVIQPKERLLAIYSPEPGFRKELTLPDGIVIEAVQPRTESGDPQEERHFLFLPGATIPGIGIQLGNHHDAHRLVHLDPMTGFPRVESVVPQ